MRKLCAGKDHVLTRGDLPGFATIIGGGSASSSNEVIGQKSADGIVVDSYKEEAKV